MGSVTAYAAPRRSTCFVPRRIRFDSERRLCSSLLLRRSRNEETDETKMKKRVAKTRARTKIERASCEASSNGLAEPCESSLVGSSEAAPKHRALRSNTEISKARRPTRSPRTRRHLPIAGIDTRLLRLACDCAHVRAPSSFRAPPGSPPGLRFSSRESTLTAHRATEGMLLPRETFSSDRAGLTRNWDRWFESSQVRSYL